MPDTIQPAELHRPTATLAFAHNAMAADARLAMITGDSPAFCFPETFQVAGSDNREQHR